MLSGSGWSYTFSSDVLYKINLDVLRMWMRSKCAIYPTKNWISWILIHASFSFYSFSISISTSLHLFLRHSEDSISQFIWNTLWLLQSDIGYYKLLRLYTKAEWNMRNKYVSSLNERKKKPRDKYGEGKKSGRYKWSKFSARMWIELNTICN